MKKMGYPKGLINYTTESELLGEKVHYLRPRLIGYGTALLLMISLFAYTITHRIPIGFDIIRDRYQLFRETSNGMITNVYTLQIVNKDQQEHTYQISLNGIDDAKIIGGNKITLARGELLANPIDVEVDPKNLHNQTNIEITISITDIDKSSNSVSQKSRFIGPKNNAQGNSWQP